MSGRGSGLIGARPKKFLVEVKIFFGLENFLVKNFSGLKNFLRLSFDKN